MGKGGKHANLGSVGGCRSIFWPIPLQQDIKKLGLVIMKAWGMVPLIPQPRRCRDISASIVRLIWPFTISPRIIGYLSRRDIAVVRITLAAAGRVNVDSCQTKQLPLEEIRSAAIGSPQIIRNCSANRRIPHRSGVVGADCRRIERNPQNGYFGEKGCRVAPRQRRLARRLSCWRGNRRFWRRAGGAC